MSTVGPPPSEAPPESSEPEHSAMPPSALDAESVTSLLDEDDSEKPRPLREYLETVLIAILVVLFLTTFAVQNSLIPSSSMNQTLLLGDYVLVNRIIFSPIDGARPSGLFAQEEIKRGDIIVFKFPEDPATLYIKRCIGIPGDVIEVRAKKVLLNGVPLDEDYVVFVDRHVETRMQGPRDHFGPFTVPEGELFAMGDNRDYSFDSRFWKGVPRENVVGKAFFIFWSRDAAEGAYHQAQGISFDGFVQSLQDFYTKTRWDRIGRIDG